MDRIKHSRFFRCISFILIVTFLTLDIAYAYPPEHNTGNSTLSTPSLLQAQPINNQVARLQQSLFSEHAILSSVYDVGEYYFGNASRGMAPLPSDHLNVVINSDLKSLLNETGINIINIVPVEYLKKNESPEKLRVALDEIGFKGTLPDEGVVFILYRKGDKRFLVQIAKKGHVSDDNLPGYLWSISDKYLVKYVPEDYAGQTVQTAETQEASAATTVETKETPKVTISEPIVEVSASATSDARNVSLASEPTHRRTAGSPGKLLSINPFAIGIFAISISDISGVTWIGILCTSILAIATLYVMNKSDSEFYGWGMILSGYVAFFSAIGCVACYPEWVLPTLAVAFFITLIIWCITNASSHPVAYYVGIGSISVVILTIIKLFYYNLLPVGIGLVGILIAYVLTLELRNLLDPLGYNIRKLTSSSANARMKAARVLMAMRDSRISPLINYLQDPKSPLTNDQAMMICECFKRDETFSVELSENVHSERKVLVPAKWEDIGYFDSVVGGWELGRPENMREVEEGQYELVEKVEHIVKISRISKQSHERKAVLKAKSIEPNAAMKSSLATQIVDLMSKRDELPAKADLLVVFGSSDARVAEEAAKLYRSGVVSNILVAGKYGSQFTPRSKRSNFGVDKDGNVVEVEAEAYKKILIKNGVPKEAIIVETKSQGMTANGTNAVRLLKQKKLDPDSIIFMHAPLLQLRGSLSLREALAAAGIDAKVYDYAAPVAIDTEKDIDSIIWQAERLFKDGVPNKIVPLIGQDNLNKIKISLDTLKAEKEANSKNKKGGSAAHLSINPFAIALGGMMLGSIISTVMDFVFMHPIVMAITASIIIISIACRIFFPMGWSSPGAQIVNLMAKRDELPQEADLLVVFGSGDARVAEEAAKLFKNYKISKVLVSGRFGKHVAPHPDNPDFGIDIYGNLVEAEALEYKRILMESGVPESVIFVEKESCEMTENAINSIPLITSLSPHTIIFMHAPLLQLRGSMALRGALGKAGVTARVYDYAAPVPVDPDQENQSIIWQARKLTYDTAQIIGQAKLDEIKRLRSVLFGDLTKRLLSTDSNVRAVTAKALGELGDNSAIQPLLDLVKRQHGIECFSVGNALVQLGYNPSVGSDEYILLNMALGRLENITGVVLSAAPVLIRALAHKSEAAAQALLDMSYIELAFLQGYLAYFDLMGPENCRALSDEEVVYIIEHLNNKQKIEDDYLNRKPYDEGQWQNTETKRSGPKTNFYSVNSFAIALGGIVLADVVNVAKDFASAHPIVTGIVGMAAALAKLGESSVVERPLLRELAAELQARWSEKMQNAQELGIGVNIDQLAGIAATKKEIDGIEYFESQLHPMAVNADNQWHRDGTVACPLDASQFNFTKLYRDFKPQHVVSEVKLSNDEWYIGMNNMPMLENHMLVVPKEARQQLAAGKDLADMQELLAQMGDEKATLLHNSLLGGAGVNSLHYHLFFYDFPIFKEGFPMYRGTDEFVSREFAGENCALEAAVYLEQLQGANQPYNLIMRHGRIIIIPRPIDTVFRFGADALAGVVFYGKDRPLEDAIWHNPGANRPASVNSSAPTPPRTTELFDLVESALTSNRMKFIDDGNDVIGAVKAKSTPEVDASMSAVNGGLTSMEIRKRVAKAMEIADSMEPGSLPQGIENKSEYLRKNMGQVEADGAMAALVFMARNAARENQKLVVGIETDWIPDMNGPDQDKGYGSQYYANNIILQEIRSLQGHLMSLGLSNVEIVCSNGNSLARVLTDKITEIEKAGPKVSFSNVVVLASQDTIYSADFARYRQVEDGKRVFLAEIDVTRVKKSYENSKGSDDKLYVELARMLYMALELAAGKEPPHNDPLIELFNKELRKVIFLPEAKVMDYEKLVDMYNTERTALVAA